jgi:hypothetical protein
MAERMSQREVYELVRRIFVAGSKQAETGEVHAMAVGFIATLDQKLAGLNDGADDGS